MHSMIDQKPSLWRFNGRTSPTYITYFVFIFWGEYNMVFERKKIILPEFRSKLFDFIYRYNLDIGSYPVQELQFPVYSLWKENHILIPDQFLFAWRFTD